MNKLLAISIVGLLSACGPLEHEQRKDQAEAENIAPTRGTFIMDGGGQAEIRTFTIDGTRCIYVGRFSAISISCDWKTP